MVFNALEITVDRKLFFKCYKLRENIYNIYIYMRNITLGLSETLEKQTRVLVANLHRYWSTINSVAYN